MIVTRLLLAAQLALFATGLPAASYKWVNQDGITVYSQRPPPGTEAEKLAPPPPPPIPPEEARQRLDEQLKSLQQTDEAQTTAAKKAKAAQAEAASRRSRCDNARRNLELLNTGGPRKRYRAADGSYQRLTEEERQKQMQDAHNDIRKFCP